MPPRISVVVPVYNVEPFLAGCLESIAAQTYGDLEVLMVNDGSTDRSREIAEGFAARDKRFRLIDQPNAGLSAARNTGSDEAKGEFLAFVDSDDLLEPNAYELLLGALDKTGSDFATGNVLRLTERGTRYVYFLEKALGETRLKTHISEHRALVADRVAWNKLWRRSFWDAQGYRFPEGVLNEDIPITLPAHFAAKSVDVISEPIYQWRIRSGEALSITQRRLEPRALTDRLNALQTVTDWLDEHGRDEWKHWYMENSIADDLRLYINLLGDADDDYRELFLDRVNAYLDDADDSVFEHLMAIDRLKWHLVRRRRMPELIEVLRFQREDMRETPPVQVRGKWYGDYPFRDDKQVGVPRDIYRLDRELRQVTEFDDLRWDGRLLHFEGHSFITRIGAPDPGSQRITIKALRRGPLTRLRLLLGGIRLKVTPVERKDVTARTKHTHNALDWSGFTATLDPASLRRLGRLRPGAWDLFVTVRAGRTKRRKARFEASPLRPLRGVDLPAPDGLRAKAVPTAAGGLALEVRELWTEVRGHRVVDGDVLELSGEIQANANGKVKLDVLRRGDKTKFRYPVEIDRSRSPATFTARVRLTDLLEAQMLNAEEPEHDEEDENEDVTETRETGEDRTVWDLFMVGGGPRRSVGLPEDGGGMAWKNGDRALLLARTKKADAALVEQGPRPIVDSAVWGDHAALELAGVLPPVQGAQEIVMHARDYAEEHAFPIEADAETGRFRVRLTPAHVESLAGAHPVRVGTWRLYLRRLGGDLDTPRALVLVSPALSAELPLETEMDSKPFTLGASRDDAAKVIVERDLNDDERGPFNQRRLRRTVYTPGRDRPLREAVVYNSFHGRQYSDSPRAIHEELVARGLPLEHLWVIRDGMADVPDGATLVRDGSREHYDALANARYVVYNDHFPDWFARRPEQVCLQTWHGHPLKKLGFDVPGRRKAGNRFTKWHKQVDNWQYVLSPSRFSTPILRRAYAIEGEMLETGYPRDDVLARPDRDVLTRELRRRLDIPDGKRVLLYAPTYRDHVVDRRGRYRLDLHLDLDRLKAAFGDDWVILFRKHHYVADVVPTDADGFVRDVSTYPDATELMLAADVLVTDYSSMMFDFANTGRPMLFFTYDLDAYQDHIRGFYVDYVDTVPGPLLRTTEELVDALGDLAGVESAYAARYASFIDQFCDLDDGKASARVADRLFSG